MLLVVEHALSQEARRDKHFLEFVICTKQISITRVCVVQHELSQEACWDNYLRHALAAKIIC